MKLFLLSLSFIFAVVPFTSHADVCAKGWKFDTKDFRCEYSGPATCPDGYKVSGDDCVKKVSADCPNGTKMTKLPVGPAFCAGAVKVSCPDGYKRVGSKCRHLRSPECNNGYVFDGRSDKKGHDTCFKANNPNDKAKAKCASGYDLKVDPDVDFVTGINTPIDIKTKADICYKDVEPKGNGGSSSGEGKVTLKVKR